MKMFQLVVLGHSGMYTYGYHAASPALAKIGVGFLIPAGGLLGVMEVNEDSPGDRALIEAEEYPGQWTIGAVGSQGYRPGIPRDSEANDPLAAATAKIPS